MRKDQISYDAMTSAVTRSPPVSMDDPAMRQALVEFIYARNGRRSAVAAARGFVSGRRIHNLRAAEKAEANAFNAIIEWVEWKVRDELNMTKP